MERAEAFSAMARTLRNLAAHNPPAFADAVGDAFAWMAFLPAKDRREFSEEFARMVTASAELDSYVALSQLVREWRATAEVWADPRLARRLRSPFQAAGEPVARPGN